MFDRIKGLFKKKEIIANVYNCKNEDDFKYEYNILMDYFCSYLDSYKREKISKTWKDDLILTFKHNKSAILFYLYLTSSVLNNQVIDEEVLAKEDFSFITQLRGKTDYSKIKNKKNTLRQIRNIFAHKRGNFYMYIENGVKKVKVEDDKFSITADLDSLNNLFDRIIKTSDNDRVRYLISDTISKVKKDEYEKVDDDASILIALNLLMCYNKESIFDKFMLGQSSLINASNFKINTTSNWTNYEAEIVKKVFGKFNIDFHSPEDKTSYIREWKEIYDIDQNAVKFANNYTYNTQNMPYDTYTKKHIPIPLFMEYLRHANAHGRIEINGDDFIFYSTNRINGSERYFFMKINREDLRTFIDSDYFKESLETSIDAHKLLFDSILYRTELSESGNSFTSYMDIYKSRKNNLNEEELIRYMYDNNKFSSYLMEFPDQTDAFLNYRLQSGMKLSTFISNLSDSNRNGFKDVNKENHLYLTYKELFCQKGLKLYDDFCIDVTKNRLKRKSKDMKLHIFFFLYALFDINLKSTEPVMEHLKNKDIKIVEFYRIALSLQNEFINNDFLYITTPSSIERLLIEIGMASTITDEYIKTLLACTYNKHHIDEKEEKKTTRHTISNIKKHSTISKVFKESAIKEMNILDNFHKKNAKMFIANIVVKIILILIWMRLLDTQLTDANTLNILISFCSTMFPFYFINGVIIRNNNDYFSRTDKLNGIVYKYSDGGAEDESGNTRSNNTRRKK